MILNVIGLVLETIRSQILDHLYRRVNHEGLPVIGYASIAQAAKNIPEWEKVERYTAKGWVPINLMSSYIAGSVKCPFWVKRSYRELMSYCLRYMPIDFNRLFCFEIKDGPVLVELLSQGLLKNKDILISDKNPIILKIWDYIAKKNSKELIDNVYSLIDKKLSFEELEKILTSDDVDLEQCAALILHDGASNLRFYGGIKEPSKENREKTQKILADHFSRCEIVLSASRSFSVLDNDFSKMSNMAEEKDLLFVNAYDLSIDKIQDILKNVPIVSKRGVYVFVISDYFDELESDFEKSRLVMAKTVVSNPLSARDYERFDTFFLSKNLID